MTFPDALAARPDACSACGGALDPMGHCAKCGAVFGEAYRCPLCQALSDVEPNDLLIYRCRACGGPRIPPQESMVSAAELQHLKRARSEQLRATAFRTGAGFALASGVLSLAVTSVVLLAISPPELAQVAALVASMVPFLLAFFAFQRARRHARQLQVELQQAWLLAASRVLMQLGGQVDSPTLAKALRVDEAKAELFLAEVSVQNFVQAPLELAPRVRVTELGDPQALAEAAAGAAPVAGARKS